MAKPGGATSNPLVARADQDTDPAYGAYYELLDLVRAGGGFVDEESMVFALAWLSAGRLLVDSVVEGRRHFDDLLARDYWERAVDEGMPRAAVTIVWERLNLHRDKGIHERAKDITRHLFSSPHVETSNLIDSLWDLPDSKLVSHDQARQGYDIKLCDLLFDLLSAPPGGRVWIPFDLSGQLVIGARRRNLTAIAVGPGWNRPNTLTRLMLILDSKSASGPQPVFQSEVEHVDAEVLEPDYLIACPPLGAKVPVGAGWGRWAQHQRIDEELAPLSRKLGDRYHLQLDRTDTWAIATLWPTVRKRAVFLTLPNVLFAKGQEQRLRESVVRGGRLTAVISLPARLLQGSGVVTAVTTMDRGYAKTCVRMIDATDCTVETKSTMRFARALDANRISSLVFDSETREGLSRDVPVEQIEAQEFNLVPSRYINQIEDSPDDERVALGELVTAIRAPVQSKEIDAVTVSEIGIPELGQWRGIQGPYEKTSAIQPRKVTECSLHAGDIILSIKGTIGKSGLIGGAESTAATPVVCSQSCVALRVVDRRISPISLLLYLRSADFKRQAEAFRVGVAVAHVTPATLLQDVRVPVNALLDVETVNARYAELLELEQQADQALRRIEQIQASL